MLISLSGTVVHKLEDSLVIETGGIGYQVWVTSQELSSAHSGQHVQYWVYESIREDAHELYGFTQWEGRKLFEQLLSVSGVGPKAALAVLSVAGIGQAQNAIDGGDVTFLQSATGVGKRTAERIAVELKDKLVPTEQITSGVQGQENTALQALESLGYSRSVAVQALAEVASDIEDEARVKEALKRLS